MIPVMHVVRDGSLRSTKLSTLALKGWHTWIITPLKINMEPKNHPSEKKENYLPNLLVYHFLGSLLIFQGVVFRRCSLPNVTGRISLLAVDFNQQFPERDLGSSLNDYIAGWQQCAFDYDICFYPLEPGEMHHEPATCTLRINLHTAIYPGNSVSQRFQGRLGSTVQQKHMTCWDHHKLQ